jgi:hypothetical protein
MLRVLTILAAIAALAVTAAPASASGSEIAVESLTPSAVANHTQGTVSLVFLHGDFSTYSGFSIDVGTSEAAKRVTDGTSNTVQFVTATPQPGGTNGIIAILIG